MGKKQGKQSKRVAEFFKSRGLEPKLSYLYGKFFTQCQAYVQIKNGDEFRDSFIAEGIARRSDDKPNEKRAEEISRGRALVCLMMKVDLWEKEEKAIEVLASGEGDRLRWLEYQRSIRRCRDSLVHGRVHLFMA